MRGDHYFAYQIEVLSDLLHKQPVLIEAVYGIGAAQSTEAFGKLWHSLTYGLFEAHAAMYCPSGFRTLQAAKA